MKFVIRMKKAGLAGSEPGNAIYQCSCMQTAVSAEVVLQVTEVCNQPPWFPMSQTEVWNSTPGSILLLLQSSQSWSMAPPFTQIDIQAKNLPIILDSSLSHIPSANTSPVPPHCVQLSAHQRPSWLSFWKQKIHLSLALCPQTLLYFPSQHLTQSDIFCCCCFKSAYLQ